MKVLETISYIQCYPCQSLSQKLNVKIDSKKKAFSASIFLKIPKNFSAVEKKLKKVYYHSCDKEVVDFLLGFCLQNKIYGLFFSVEKVVDR